MSSNVASSSTGVPVTPSSDLPKVEEVKGFNARKLNRFLKGRLNNIDNHIDTITVSQEVDGSTFLDFTAIDFERWGIPGGSSKRIENLIKDIRGEQPVATAMNPTDLAFVFIDNTNVCMQGKKMVMWSENVLQETINIDYGRLVNFVLNGRKLGDDPVIAGSLPYMDDTLWNYLKEIGFKAHKFPRNSKGQEKEVDSEVNASMADVMERHKRPGTIILLAGDGDYGPRIRRALLRGWTVEIWFWKTGMAPRIKDVNLPDYPELKTIYMNMDPHYKDFMHAYGVSERKKYLEIFGNIVNYESIMTCCVELGLFCAWCKFGDSSLRIYCTIEKWEVLKNYMMNKYPQAQEIIQVGGTFSTLIIGPTLFSRIFYGSVVPWCTSN